MTLKEFFKRLPTDLWVLNRDCEIRRIGSGKCPICQLSRRASRRLDFMSAASEIGLSQKVAACISRAADGCDDMTPTELRIRHRLLKHCNLTEPQQ